MKSLHQSVALISRLSEKAVKATIVVMVAAMTIIVIIQVFLRYLFLFSLSWSEEIARYLMIWISFLGASIALKHGMHVGVEFFVSRVPERPRKTMALAAKWLMLFFLIFFTIGGFEVAWAVRDQDSPALIFSMLYAYLAAPVGGFFMIIQLLNLMIGEGSR